VTRKAFINIIRLLALIARANSPQVHIAPFRHILDHSVSKRQLSDSEFARLRSLNCITFFAEFGECISAGLSCERSVQLMLEEGPTAAEQFQHENLDCLIFLQIANFQFSDLVVCLQ
jgi:hypothetical protein